MSRTVVIAIAALMGVAVAGVLLGAMIPGGGGHIGPGVALSVTLGCAAVAAIIGMALTKKTPPAR